MMSTDPILYRCMWIKNSYSKFDPAWAYLEFFEKE